jgi:Tfp pilus assembly protein PilO
MNMNVMKDLDFREITNARIASRMRQVIILVVLIVLGVLYSSFANAQTNPKHRVYKSKQTCSTLAQKRNQSQNIRVAVNYKKVKYKPMAEMEAPASARIATQDKGARR